MKTYSIKISSLFSLFFLLLSGPLFSQTTSGKIWAYISAEESKILKKGCPKEVFTGVFEIPNWGSGYEEYTKELIEETFEKSYEFDKHDLVYSVLEVHTFMDKNDAEENLDIAFNNALVNNELYFSKTGAIDKEQKCGPVFIDWKYKAQPKSSITNIRFLKDEWKQIDSTDTSFLKGFINQIDHDLISSELLKKTKTLKHILPWYKAVIYETQILKNEIPTMAFYILRTEKESYIVTSKNKLFKDFSKNPPSQLSYDRYLMEYFTFCINSAYTEEGRFRLISRDNFPIFFEKTEITPDELEFEIFDPKIIYSNDTVSIISALFHYDESLYHVIMEIDLVSGKIEMKNEVVLKTDLKVPQPIVFDGVFLLNK